MGFGLLFVLVGGYLFLTWCHWTRFTVRRQSGHHLLFWSASVGLVLLAGARVVELLSSDVVQSWPYLVDLWQRVAPFPYVGTIALAFLLGPCGALVINRFHSESSGAIRAVHRAGNSLELLFIEAMYSDSTVELTLDSGKGYVGWILNAPVAEPERKFVEMLPLASGFAGRLSPKSSPPPCGSTRPGQWTRWMSPKPKSNRSSKPWVQPYACEEDWKPTAVGYASSPRRRYRRVAGGGDLTYSAGSCTCALEEPLRPADLQVSVNSERGLRGGPAAMTPTNGKPRDAMTATGRSYAERPLCDHAGLGFPYRSDGNADAYEAGEFQGVAESRSEVR